MESEERPGGCCGTNEEVDDGLLSPAEEGVTGKFSEASLSDCGGEDQANGAEVTLVAFGDVGLGNGVGVAVGVGVEFGVGVEKFGKADTKDEDMGDGKCRWRIRSKLEYAR